MPANKIRILIVEDNVGLMYSLRLALAPYFDIDTAETFQEAKDVLADKSREFGCVFLDLILPNGKGLGLIRDLRETCPEVEIVVLSGGDYQTDDVLGAGARAFLRKGNIDTNLLRETVDTVIKSAATHAARKVTAPAIEQVQAVKRDLKKLDSGDHLPLSQPDKG